MGPLAAVGLVCCDAFRHQILVTEPWTFFRLKVDTPLILTDSRLFWLSVHTSDLLTRLSCLLQLDPNSVFWHQFQIMIISL